MTFVHPLLIDGRAVAETINQESQARANAFCQKHHRRPHLGVVLVGENSASLAYVGQKRRQAALRGFDFTLRTFPATCRRTEVLGAIEDFNSDPQIDAQLLQLPLPKHLCAEALMGQIAPQKDADGLHPHNLGKLMANLDGPKPCTPAGCMALLANLEVDLKGKNVVVIGRSQIVGRPLALMLSAADATVTLCHRQTHNLPTHLLRADIVVAAAGVPHLVGGGMLKSGAVVLDVGITRENNRLVGDVDTAGALARGCRVTPVPGGIGPMTVAMLMVNVATLAELGHS